MKKTKRWLSLLCAALMFCGMVLVAPTAFATEEEAQWIDKTPFSIARQGMGAITYGGKIYLFGGHDGTNRSNRLDIYDPETDTWTTGRNMPDYKNGFGYVEQDGKIYVIGGLTDTGGRPYTSVYIYTISSNTWNTGPTLKTGRLGISSVSLNGLIYAIGGQGDENTQYSKLNSVEVYNPSTNTWTNGASMNLPRYDNCSAVVNGKIYVFGGVTDSSSWTDTVEVFDPETNTWTLSDTRIPQEIWGATATAIGDKIYLVGGENSDREYLGTTYIYDTISDTWQTGPSFEPPRYSHTATAYGNSIYFFGGFNRGVRYNDVKALDVTTITEPPVASAKKLAVLLNVDETVQLSVSNVLADNANFTWTTSNASVATVDAGGKVTAVGAGLCEIYAQHTDGSRQSIPVKVFDNGQADLWRLAVHLTPGQNQMLYLTDDPADSTFTSLDPSIATVDATGKVTAVSDGLVIIQATTGGETYQIYVRVVT